MHNDLLDKNWYQALLIVYQIIMTIILILGFIGNFLNLIIFYRQKGVRPFTRILLLQLTIYDILGLSLSGIHLEYLVFNQGTDFRLSNYLFCQIHGFFSFVFVFGSMHTLCSVAIDRYLLIKYPTNITIK